MCMYVLGGKGKSAAGGTVHVFSTHKSLLYSRTDIQSYKGQTLH